MILLEKIGERFARDLRETCERLARDLRETCERLARDLREICERFARDLRETCERFARDLREIDEKSLNPPFKPLPDNSPNQPELMFSFYIHNDYLLFNV